MPRPASRTLESAVEREAVQAAIRELGLEVVKMKVRTWPDRMFLIPGGRPLFIELKNPHDGKLSAGQKLRVYRLMRDGYDVEIHDNVAEVLDSLRQHINQDSYGRRKNLDKQGLLPSNASMAEVSRYIATVDKRLNKG